MKSHTLAGIGLAAIFALLAPSAPSNADETDFISLFGGSWSGSGIIIKDGTTRQLSCRATGSPSPNRLTIEGDCSLFIVSVRIAADIAYDPASGRYTGTYTGAEVGQALVSGQRDGDLVNLVITWPRPVHGDTLAHMTVSNSGVGNLQILISDNVIPGGPEQQTSGLSFGRDGTSRARLVLTDGP